MLLLFFVYLCLEIVFPFTDLALDSHFGENATIIETYIPANYLDAGLDPISTSFVRRYPIVKPTKFRVMWNPARCADSKARPFGVILSFLKDWTPQYNPTILELLHYSVSFSNPQTVKYPIEVHWERKYKVHVASTLNGSVAYSNEFLEMSMNDGGFFAEIFPFYRIKTKVIPGVAVISFYDWETGKKRDEIVLPLKNNPKYLTVYSRLQTKCPAFISHIDKNFQAPTWDRYPKVKNEIKKLKMTRHQEKMQEELTFISLHLAVVFALVSAVFFSGNIVMPLLVKQQALRTTEDAERILDLGMDWKSSGEAVFRKRRGKASRKLGFRKSRTRRNKGDRSKNSTETARGVKSASQWLKSTTTHSELDKTQKSTESTAQ